MGRRTGLAHDPKILYGSLRYLAASTTLHHAPISNSRFWEGAVGARRPIISNRRLVQVDGGRQMFICACHPTQGTSILGVREGREYIVRLAPSSLSLERTIDHNQCTLSRERERGYSVYTVYCTLSRAREWPLCRNRRRCFTSIFSYSFF